MPLDRALFATQIESILKPVELHKMEYFRWDFWNSVVPVRQPVSVPEHLLIEKMKNIAKRDILGIVSFRMAING